MIISMSSAMLNIFHFNKVYITSFLRMFFYIRCSKRKRGWENCSQGSIRLEDLEEQIDLYLAKIEIPSEFFDWWLAVLRNNFQKDFETKESIQRQLKRLTVLSAWFCNVC